MASNPLKKIRYNSPVVLTFALLSLIVLVLDYLTGGTTTGLLFCTYRTSPLDLLGYVRMFGHVLGHAGLEHYIGNMTLILVLGPMLEEKYGSKNLLLAIAITAVVSAVVHGLVSTGALLGASGIVFMMIMLSSLTGMKSGTVPLTMILVAVIYIGGEIIDGIANQDSVSQLTHIVGGICGTAIGFSLTKKKKK